LESVKNIVYKIFIKFNPIFIHPSNPPIFRLYYYSILYQFIFLSESTKKILR